MKQKSGNYQIRHDRKSGKIKAFLIGTVVTIAVGASYNVSSEYMKEKQKKEWKAMNADADSISVDKGHFYAIKKVDQKAIDVANAKIDTLMKKRQVLIDKANRDFIEAFNNRDATGMKKAIADHADNINEKNAQGLTPLMVLLREVESTKSYLCARALIPYADVNVRDDDGTSAVEYVAVNKKVRGEVLKKEIENRKNQQNNQVQEEMKNRHELEECLYNLTTYEVKTRYGVDKNIDNPTTYDELTTAIMIAEEEREKIYDDSYEVEVYKREGVVGYSAKMHEYSESECDYRDGFGSRGRSGHRKDSYAEKLMQVREVYERTK